MDNAKFRRILTDKYPIILIDEYQDTNAGWIDSTKNHFLGKGGGRPAIRVLRRPLAEDLRRRMR